MRSSSGCWRISRKRSWSFSFISSKENEKDLKFSVITIAPKMSKLLYLLVSFWLLSVAGTQISMTVGSISVAGVLVMVRLHQLTATVGRVQLSRPLTPTT